MLALPAVAYLLCLGADGDGTFATEGTGHAALLALGGVFTAVPLMLFGAAAIRIPLTTLGLIQYLAPTLQFAIGVLIYTEPMPASRLAGFALVWVALAVFTVGRRPGQPPRAFAAAAERAARRRVTSIRPRRGPWRRPGRARLSMLASLAPTSFARDLELDSRESLAYWETRAQLAAPPRVPPPPRGARHGHPLASPRRRGRAARLRPRAARRVCAARRGAPAAAVRAPLGPLVARRATRIAAVAGVAFVALVVAGLAAAVELRRRPCSAPLPDGRIARYGRRQPAPAYGG